MNMKISKKIVEVNLYDQFILHKGVPWEFCGGFRHQGLDTIFIISPEFLKHELYALGSRDVGVPSEYHCLDSNCFGSHGVTQEEYAKLCVKHVEFFRDNLAGRFEYTLNPIIFSNKERYETLLELLNQHSELFSQQTEIPVKLNKAVRKDRSEIEGYWLISLRDNGYKYHKPDFKWEEHYRRELGINMQSEPGNLAISIHKIASIAKYGNLDGYRNRKIL